jgi:alpha-glucosidase
MLLLTLRGTPTLYYGDELGMQDVPIPPELVQDPWEKGVPGLGLGRDPERTPMQWSAAPNAGFSRATPWLPLAADFAAVNVAAQQGQSGSMLALYRALIELRRREPTLAVGGYVPVAAEGMVLAYRRCQDDHEFLIALNLGHEPARLQLPAGRGHEPVLTTLVDGGRPPRSGVLELRGDEGVILRAL